VVSVTAQRIPPLSTLTTPSRSRSRVLTSHSWKAVGAAAADFTYANNSRLVPCHATSSSVVQRRVDKWILHAGCRKRGFRPELTTHSFTALVARIGRAACLRFGLIARHGLPGLDGKVHGLKSNATYTARYGDRWGAGALTDSYRLGSNRIEFDVTCSRTRISWSCYQSYEHGKTSHTQMPCTAPVGGGGSRLRDHNPNKTPLSCLNSRTVFPTRGRGTRLLFLSTNSPVSHSLASRLAAAPAMQLEPVEAPRHTPGVCYSTVSHAS
jgi:hypothetical protein